MAVLLVAAAAACGPGDPPGLLFERGARAEGLRYLGHGAEHATQPQPIAEELARALSEGPEG